MLEETCEIELDKIIEISGQLIEKNCSVYDEQLLAIYAYLKNKAYIIGDNISVLKDLYNNQDFFYYNLKSLLELFLNKNNVFFLRYIREAVELFASEGRNSIEKDDPVRVEKVELLNELLHLTYDYDSVLSSLNKKKINEIANAYTEEDCFERGITRKYKTDILTIDEMLKFDLVCLIYTDFLEFDGISFEEIPKICYNKVQYLKDNYKNDEYYLNELNINQRIKRDN